MCEAFSGESLADIKGTVNRLQKECIAGKQCPSCSLGKITSQSDVIVTGVVQTCLCDSDGNQIDVQQTNKNAKIECGLSARSASSDQSVNDIDLTCTIGGKTQQGKWVDNKWTFLTSAVSDLLKLADDSQKCSDLLKSEKGQKVAQKCSGFNNTKPNGTSLSAGAIAGIVVGTLAGLFCCTVAFHTRVT